MISIKEGLTFDDVLLVPAYSEILPSHTSIQTHLTNKIKLNIPLLSAAMDTVSESDLVIALAQEGGLGFIHKNLSIDEQCRQILKVKRFESGIVENPITINQSQSVKSVLKIMADNKISGLPVIEKNKLIGIVTNRDLRFETNLDQEVKNLMTPKKKLVTVRQGVDKKIILEMMHKHRLEKLLVTDSNFNLKGLITVKDILKSDLYPNSCKDQYERLRVGAAVGISKDTNKRTQKLVDAGADVILIDTAHAHTKTVINVIKNFKKNFSNIDLVVGNIATSEAALRLVDLGVDAIKVGIGPGSICTTRIVSGVGVPQLTAIYEVKKAIKNSKIPIIADGGIRYSGDIAKAIAAGADSVMIGGLFAGTEEAPGEMELYQGRTYKTYRGMGSVGAMNKGSADRYFQNNLSADDSKYVPEGVEGRVPYKGPLKNVVYQLCGGLKSSMGYLGAKNIADMRKAEFVKITSSGMKESHAHDVQIIKEAPNYRVE